MNAARHALRKALRARRAALDPVTRRRAQAQIHRRILQHSAFRHARRVALYCATGSELNLMPVLHAALRAQKQVFLPRVRGQTMHFARFERGTALVRGAFGIAEPAAGAQRIAVNRIDLVIVPLVGFGDNGQRLGQGGGYYDRALARRLHGRLRRPWVMGAAYAAQRCPPWRLAAWDVGMDVVIHDTISTPT